MALPPRPSLRDALRAEGAKGALIATVSTVVFLAVVGVAVVNSPGWQRVRESFFDGQAFAESFPDILSGFWVNVQMFLIAEVLVLVFALLLAVLRSIPSPVFFPLRLVAIVYTDLFRGIPTLLVIFLLGFGMPALGLQGLPTSEMFWGVVALVLVYSAYVAEVYRAGIESVHPSQRAAARSLGLGQWQALRFVILPQAVRRVIPPLLNDFVGLQKETALVAVLGVREAVREAGIYSTSTFDYTSYLGAALLFIAVTIPLARFTDHLIERGRRRREAGGA
jgi:polar amino acid transport system permease protein